MHLSEKRIPNVVIGLTLFWLGIVEAFFWTGSFNLHFLPMWAGALLVGVLMAKSSSDEFRESILKRLRYNKSAKLPFDDKKAFTEEIRGIRSNLGGVPLYRYALPCNPSLDIDLVVSTLPKELNREQFMKLFSDVLPTSQSTTPFKELTSRAVRTLCHPDFINHPAGIDRHGGRSLMTHSLLVTALMLHKASAYKYAPKLHTPNDASFNLDPKDPLIAPIGFLHDIGKLNKLVVDSNGGKVSIFPNHNLESARIASDFNEYWNCQISSENRLLLQDALSYSCSINSLPVKKSHLSHPNPSSDRLYALIDLLSSCDTLASSIEKGAPYDFEANAEFESIQMPQEIEAINIYEEFLNFITVNADINAMNGIKSVGFRYKGMIDETFMNVVIIDEKKFSDDFSKYLDKTDLKARDGKRSVVTGLVLDQLDENQILVRNPKEVGLRPARDCLYKMVFKAPESNEASNSIVLSSAFVISLDDLERFKMLDKIANCRSIPSFSNSVYGNKKFADSSSSSILEDEAKKALGIKITGQKEAVSVTSLSKKVAKTQSVSQEKSEQHRLWVIQKIKTGLQCGNIRPVKVQNDSGNVLHVVGYNDFFVKLGINLEENDGDDFLKAVGILSVKRSKTKPSDFVFNLQGDIYNK